jgi:hypothetical protein
LTYDRNSNITSADDSVHAGFDVAYTMDSVNRLTRAEEGTLGSGTISNRKRDEQWTLNHTGNWDRDKVDLNGDTDFVDANELDDTRTPQRSERADGARDTDSNASNNYTLSYDGSGDLTDDGQSYKYEYDAFLRLRKVKKPEHRPRRRVPLQRPRAPDRPSTRTRTPTETSMPMTSGTTTPLTSDGGTWRGSGSQIAPEGRLRAPPGRP